VAASEVANWPANVHFDHCPPARLQISLLKLDDPELVLLLLIRACRLLLLMLVDYDFGALYLAVHSAEILVLIVTVALWIQPLKSILSTRVV